MLKLSTLFLLPCVLLCCTSRTEQKPPVVKKDSTAAAVVNTLASGDLGYYKVDGDSLVIPSFEIQVNLSPRANEKLKKDKESIIVAAYFSGIPTDTTTEEFLKSGGISLATMQKELRGNQRVANMEGAKFSRSLYDSLADKDIQVLINVYSGRRSGPDNILNCDFLEKRMSEVKNRRFVLNGKLIVEH